MIDRATKPEVIIYTDGSCLGNPGPGGWGAILIHRETQKRMEISGDEAATTNNRMELTAAIEALKRLTRASRIALYTDSTYVRDGISKWIVSWKARNWRTKSGSAVKNEDLWRELDAQRQRHEVDWIWVRAHADNVENNRADALARKAAEKS